MLPKGQRRSAYYHRWRCTFAKTNLSSGLGVELATVVYRGTKKQRWRDPIRPWRSWLYIGRSPPCTEYFRSIVANPEGPRPIFDGWHWHEPAKETAT